MLLMVKCEKKFRKLYNLWFSNTHWHSRLYDYMSTCTVRSLIRQEQFGTQTLGLSTTMVGSIYVCVYVTCLSFFFSRSFFRTLPPTIPYLHSRIPKIKQTAK